MNRRVFLLLLLGIALTLAVGGAWLWRHRIKQRTYYTDASSIHQPASTGEALLRHTLWKPPEALTDSINTDADEYEGRLSPDGQTLYFVRGKAGGNADIFASQRIASSGQQQQWSEPQALVELNSDADDLGPELSSDGRSIYFYSNREGGAGGYDVWVTERGEFGWQPPRNLGAAVNSEFNEYGPALAPDGRSLYFSSDRERDLSIDGQNWDATLRDNLPDGDFDLYVAAIDDDGRTLGGAKAIEALNSPQHEGAPSFSPAGDFLYFSSNRRGGEGGFDLYRSRLLRGQWQQPTNLGPKVNSAFNELDPAPSLDGFALHLSSDRPLPRNTAADEEEAPIGTQSSYNIYYTTSREVFIERAAAAAIDWASLWGLLAPVLLWLLLGLASLLLLLAAIKRLQTRSLSLLTRCLLASLIAHMVLLIALTFWQVTTSVAGMIEQGGGRRVILAASPGSGGGGDDLTFQVRGGLTEVGLDAQSAAAARAQANDVIDDGLALVKLDAAALQHTIDQRSFSDVQPDDGPGAAVQPPPVASAFALAHDAADPVEVASPASESPIAVQEREAAAPSSAAERAARERSIHTAALDERAGAISLAPRRSGERAAEQSVAAAQPVSEAAPAGPLPDAQPREAPAQHALAQAINVPAMAAPAQSAAEGQVRPMLASAAGANRAAAGSASALNEPPSGGAVQIAPSRAAAAGGDRSLAPGAASHDAPLRARPNDVAIAAGGSAAAQAAPAAVVDSPSVPAASGAVVSGDESSVRLASDHRAAFASPRSSAAMPAPAGPAGSNAVRVQPRSQATGTQGQGSLAKLDQSIDADQTTALANAVAAPGGRALATGSISEVGAADQGDLALPTSPAAEAGGGGDGKEAAVDIAAHAGDRGAVRAASPAANALSGEGLPQAVHVAPRSSRSFAGAEGSLAGVDRRSAGEAQPAAATQPAGGLGEADAASNVALTGPANIALPYAPNDGKSGSSAGESQVQVAAMASGSAGQRAEGGTIAPPSAAHSPLHLPPGGSATGGLGVVESSLASTASIAAGAVDSRPVGETRGVPLAAAAPASSTSFGGDVRLPAASTGPTAKTAGGESQVRAGNAIAAAMASRTETPVLAGGDAGPQGTGPVRIAPAARGEAGDPAASSLANTAAVATGDSQPSTSVGAASIAHGSSIAPLSAPATATVRVPDGKGGGVTSASRAPSAPGAPGALPMVASAGHSRAELPAAVGAAAVTPGGTSGVHLAPARAKEAGSSGGDSLIGDAFAADSARDAANAAAGANDGHPLALPAPALAMSDIEPVGDLGAGGRELRLPVELAPLTNPYTLRSEDKRMEVVKKMGGSEKTEAAVAAALKWLAAHQSEDGRWAARKYDDVCGGCGGEAKFDTDVAITGLALLCFLAADHTHTKEGPYREQVKRGLDWLIAQQKPDGDWRGGETLYSHGIASIAASEALGMTGDQKLREPVRLAVDFIVKARNSRMGGWRYEPGQAGDTSVLGWQVMALISAKRAGIALPDEVLDAARQWIDLVNSRTADGRYAYQPGQNYSPSMTAEGMYVLQLLGAGRDEARMLGSAQYIDANPPRWSNEPNTYYWYYATLAMYQHQGETWTRWNEAVTQQLLDNQRTSGPAAGSWDPLDNWSKIGGRIYQTALCTLMLEVYYRYLPLYSAVEDAQ